MRCMFIVDLLYWFYILLLLKVMIPASIDHMLLSGWLFCWVGSLELPRFGLLVQPLGVPCVQFERAHAVFWLLLRRRIFCPEVSGRLESCSQLQKQLWIVYLGGAFIILFTWSIKQAVRITQAGPAPGKSLQFFVVLFESIFR